MILIDSSAWIEILRGRGDERLRDIASHGEIVTCLPVMQEVLQGFDDERAFQIAAQAFADIRVIEDPLTRAVFDEATTLYRRARRAGVTIRSSVDCLIAACALRNAAAVLHADRDFVMLARISDLRVVAL